MNIKLLGNKLLVKREDADTKTTGGIILPDQSKEVPRCGKVIKVGVGKRYDDGVVYPMRIKEGDKVIFSRYAGVEIVLDDKEYLTLTEEEILAIYE